MKTNKLVKKLNRFTTLPFLIDMLESNKIIFNDPLKFWDDRNDTLLIETYKQKSEIKSLFALCFTYKSETIHHWKSYANSASGCCIEFDALKLLEAVSKHKEIRYDLVSYIKISDIDLEKIRTKDLPFVKRTPYKIEFEYRIIWEDDSVDDSKQINIDLDIINKITFNQQMPVDIFYSTQKLISERYNFPRNKIIHSTLYKNDVLIQKFKSINCE